MLELKEKPECCGKLMQHIPHAQSLCHTVNAEIQQWICWECGGFITLVDDQLDEEELETMRETYGN